MRDLAEPVSPSPFFSEHQAQESHRLAQTQSPLKPVGQGAPEALIQELTASWEGLHNKIIETSRAIHADPELGFEEHRAVARLVDEVKKYGIKAEVGAYGVPSAFRAVLEAGTEGLPQTGPNRPPTVAILSEYDALPELGHACGHNVMAAAGLGAFLSLVDMYQRDPNSFTGRVVYLGTPAEEGGTGKEVMARGGAFQPDSLDAVMMVHSYSHDLEDQTWLGCRRLAVTFTGVAAHASSQPFRARNALDAVTLAYQGIGLLRQQMAPIDRLHAVITEGGQWPSIIPESSALSMYVRSKYPDTLRDLSTRIEDIMRGAALMTGCGVSLEWDPGMPVLPVRTNRALTSRWVLSQQRLGRNPLATGVVSETIAASTDFGNVSMRVPGAHPLIKISGEDAALHTRVFEQAAGSPAGDQGAVDSAFGLASMALDVLTDSQLREAVRDEFAAAGGAVDVEHYFD